jgi:hypothetical protein
MCISIAPALTLSSSSYSVSSFLKFYLNPMSPSLTFFLYFSVSSMYLGRYHLGGFGGQKTGSALSLTSFRKPSKWVKGKEFLLRRSL